MGHDFVDNVPAAIKADDGFNLGSLAVQRLRDFRSPMSRRAFSENLNQVSSISTIPSSVLLMSKFDNLSILCRHLNAVGKLIPHSSAALRRVLVCVIVSLYCGQSSGLRRSFNTDPVNALYVL